MSTQLSPQLTDGDFPALEAGIDVLHLLAPIAEAVTMPAGSYHVCRILKM